MARRIKVTGQRSSVLRLTRKSPCLRFHTFVCADFLSVHLLVGFVLLSFKTPLFYKLLARLFQEENNEKDEGK